MADTKSTHTDGGRRTNHEKTCFRRTAGNRATEVTYREGTVSKINVIVTIFNSS